MAPGTNRLICHYESLRFPNHLKTALIPALLKKTGLNRDSLKNYCPVSNLTFISKVIEKVISGRLHEHLIGKSCSILCSQRTEINKHSTETALIDLFC